MSNLEPRLLEIAGRAHILLVHLPIGLILAAGLIELVGRGRTKPGARSAARWCLGLGAAAAVLSATTGWIHAGFVPVARAQGGTLLLHRCGGIATALAATTTWVLSRPPGKPDLERPAYRIGLAASCALVVLTGHWGGTLVHGSNFLLGPLWDEGEPALDEGAATQTDPTADPGRPGTDFARDVEPILAAHCYECHGERRQKAHLRLDRLEELFARSEQTVIVPRDPEASELIARVSLPADDLDVMPAKGEHLTADQIETLRRWIADGARLGGEPAAAEDAHEETGS